MSGTPEFPVRSVRGRRLRWVALLIALILPVAALREGLYIPREWKPWVPLTLQEEPGPFTRIKLARLADDPQACLRLLAESPFRFTALPDRVTAPGCGFRSAVRIERAGVGLGPAISLSCRAAVSLALWERHVLQPAGLHHLGTSVADVEHFGSYACRNVNHRADGRRSGHATADAVDIAGVVLADGRRIRVLRDWPASGDEGRFLRALHAGACRYFDMVLGPDYNAAHRDHLHLERGGFRGCR